ncbi:MAG: Verru_Chthon cassette protein A [Verrucomicrobiota bacterium]
MALVIVLASLVLLSILVVSILVSARQEVSSSNSYGAGSDAKLLADLPLNLVTAQIAKATSDPDQAWISQPGLLRTFSPDGQQKAFKLYSSYKMEESGTYDPGSNTTLSAEVPDKWYEKPSEFVDLNRPIQFGNRKIYPIADPNAYDAGKPSDSLVQGFSYDVPTAIGPPAGSATTNQLPMPVRWIYVTAGGEFVGVDDAKRREAVARVAFWTDDESCKVNLNTACGGVFYDTPCTNTLEDHMLGRTQPIAQEYQRWPGHPATTSLAPVLKPLRDIADPVARFQVAAGLTPRIAWGGSSGGTKYAWLTRELGATDMDRLYATPDELSFGKGLDAAGLRVSNTVNGIDLESSGQKLDELRFFLTTQSRAPELTLFNRPRISLWPFNEEMVQTTVDGRLTPEDRLIRFASELGGVKTDGSLDYTKRKRFYFQRKSAWDPAADWRDIPSNRAIFRYLQDMTARPLPSAKTARSGAGTFVSKFGQANRDSILTCMWDYLRSGVDTVNQAYVPVGFLPYSFPLKYYDTKTSTFKPYDTTISGFNDVAPLTISDLGTKGMGRYPVLSEVIFQFVNMGDAFETDAGGAKTGCVIRKVRMVALLNFQMPVSSLHGSLPRLQVKITGATPFNFVTDNTLLTPVPSPLMNPGLSPPMQVRNQAAAGGSLAWQTSLGSAGIGFPAAASDAGFRNTNFIGSFFNGWGYDTRAGLLGPGFGMFAVIENKTGISNSSTDGAKVHRLKVLSNRTSTMETADLTWRNSSTTSWAAREDVYYPFVSDVIEFRLPQNGASAALDPVNANGKDYFEAFLSGGSLDVAIYPGLQDSATALSPVSSNWQAQTGANCLMHTTINVGNTIIPLPRPGANNSYRTTTLLAMGNYYERANYANSTTCYVDDLLLVPCKDTSNVTVTKQMDVFRSCLL